MYRGPTPPHSAPASPDSKSFRLNRSREIVQSKSLQASQGPSIHLSPFTRGPICAVLHWFRTLAAMITSGLLHILLRSQCVLRLILVLLTTKIVFAFQVMAIILLPKMPCPQLRGQMQSTLKLIILSTPPRTKDMENTERLQIKYATTIML